MKKICLLAIGSFFSTLAFCQNAATAQTQQSKKGHLTAQSATATPAATTTPAVTSANGSAAVNPKTGVAPVQGMSVASIKAARKNKTASMKATTTTTKASN